MNTTDLERLGACSDSLEWVAQQRNATQAWRDCERGDWMIWLIVRTAKPGSPRHRRAVALLCRSMRRALRFVPRGERRPLKAIRLAEQWTRSPRKVSTEGLRVAADAAADAVAYVAYVAYAADAAADAAACVVDAVAHADPTCSLRDCARLVRKEFPRPPRLRR